MRSCLPLLPTLNHLSTLVHTSRVERTRSGQHGSGAEDWTQPVRPAPRRVSASAPRSEAKESASWTSIPCASANVSPAAKQSPAP
jgi:hypothetical protein